ncbi:MAG TPA: SEC-C metal-binding domain-containing protein [Planctomycetota bacterium]|jgi:hypothetical protein|nr:SEC-C metal-binding domain-containing protein [Planctomycetota bacterium]
MHETLTDDALLQLLSTEEDRLPRSAVDEIVRRAARLSPALAHMADDRALWEGPTPGSFAPAHATFLLAALRTPDSFEILLRAVRIAVELEDYFAVDYGDVVLASAGPDALSTLKSVAKSTKEPFELRLSTIEAVARIGLLHPDARAVARDFLLETARNRREDADLRNAAAHAFLEYATSDDGEALHDLQDEDLLDDEAVQLALTGTVEPYYGKPIDLLELYDPEALEQRRRFHEELEGSAPAELDLPDKASLHALSSLDEPVGPPAPLINASPKVGRNDPCPCGSGSKYKKCCGT